MSDPDFFAPVELPKVSEDELYDEELKKIAALHGVNLAALDIDGGGRDVERISLRDKLIVGLYMEGKPLTQIARQVKVSTKTVSTTLKRPAVKSYIMAWGEDVDMEIEALRPRAIDAVRKALGSSDHEVALKGVDRYMKLSDKYNNGEIGVTVNVINEGRARFVNSLKELAKEAKVVDAEYEEVPQTTPENSSADSNE